MDQVKEFLRQVVKYRFWISVSIAALFAMLAYILGSGPVRARADTETKAITSAVTDVKQYTLPGIPNPSYKPVVDEKTAVLTKDVNGAWKQLYSRQAPLLTWPETVQTRFQKWGRKWPEATEVAESAVQIALVDYVEAYEGYVDKVYHVFKPFNFETGEGIVSAPSREALLRPVAFDRADPPDLGKVWSAQERLWIQRTALEVVAQVNRNAKDWDSAIIKQINVLEVGNNQAQDQRSMAKGEALEEAEKILAPGQTEEETDTAGGAGSAGGMGGMMAMMRGMKGGEGGSGGMRGGASEAVFYVKPENDKGQYKILPILMTVLIDQDHVQDLLVEFENSPMSIQVMEIDIERPSARVTKPEKGVGNMAGYGGMMGGGMGGYGGMAAMMRGRGMGGMGGYGGMMGGGMGGYGGMAAMMRGRGMDEGGMGMMGGGAPARQGTDKRAVDRAEERKKTEKAVEEAKGPSLFDPYFNIIEVTVYGQARFYNPPPEEPPTESLGGGDTTEPAAKPEGVAEKAEVKQDKAAKTEEAKPAENAGDDDKEKAEAPKAEAPKTGAPKPDVAKAEPPESAPAKVETKQPEAPKEEAPPKS